MTTPEVHEVELPRESLYPVDDFGYPQFYQRALFNYKLAWDNNELEWMDVANGFIPRDYSKQLEFHHAEFERLSREGVAPLGQLRYHRDMVRSIGRLCNG